MNNKDEIFISIVTASISGESITNFLSHIENTAKSPQQIEILISVDTGDQGTITAINNYKSGSKMRVEYLEGTRTRGYFSANHEYNKLLGIASNSAYFFAAFSDKLRIKTLHWDERLRAYYKFYEDDIFRVKVSWLKNIQYHGDRYIAFPKCENFAFFTRKWMDLVGGWGDCWGSDSWQQLIEYDLSEMDLEFSRGVPANDINYETYHYSSGKGRIADIKTAMCAWVFRYYPTNPVPSLLSKLMATKLYMYIKNYNSLKDGYKFIFDEDKQKIFLYDNKEKLVDSTEIKFKDIKYSSIYTQSFMRPHYKRFAKMYKLRTGRRDVIYLSLKFFGMVTTPIWILWKRFEHGRLYNYVLHKVKYLRDIKKYRLVGLDYETYPNGFCVITCPQIENEIQKNYDDVLRKFGA